MSVKTIMVVVTKGVKTQSAAISAIVLKDIFIANLQINATVRTQK